MPVLKSKTKPRWTAKEKAAKPHQGRKERSKLYDSTKWRSLRDSILLRDNYLCKSCHSPVGERKGDYAVDHIKAVNKGGAFFEVANLQTLCKRCHERKSQGERHS